MKNVLAHCGLSIILFTMLSSFSCDMSFRDESGFAVSGPEGPGITVISWNVQEFFDAVDTGNEYEDFTGIKSAWTEAKYTARLDRLCSFIESTNADVYCFMEIENQSVIHDIANRLHLRHSRTAAYPYAAFCRGNVGSIGCAVLSRIPLENMTAHNATFKGTLPVPLYNGYQAGIPLEPPVMRPLLEVTLAPFEEGKPPLKLFVNHWKSKSSGGRESELWRTTQECVLSMHMSDALDRGYPCIAVGDYNRDLNEFYWDTETSRQHKRVLLRNLFGSLAVESPWFTSNQAGSYYYDEDWSRIDHIFTAGGLRCASFDVLNRGELVNGSGTPNSYSVWTGEGNSDHFPLKVKIQYTND